MGTFLKIVGACTLIVLAVKCGSSCVTVDKRHGAATLQVPADFVPPDSWTH